VPLLLARGHDVTGTTRSEERAQAIRDAGAEAIVLDPLNRDVVAAAVTAATPDVIVHELTALAGMSDFRKFEKTFAMTNRLRTDATDNLIAAAEHAGVPRLVAQSFAGWPYAPTGGAVKTEDDPLDPAPPAQMANTLAAIEYLEAAVTGSEGIDGLVLRYGGFYGPGSGIEPGGEQLEQVRRRRFPLIGSGAGVWSFVHIDDAAAATALAIEHGAPGIYNIVDDDPAPVSEWLPALADAAGAKPARRLPARLARLIAGEHVVALMERSRGASNAKAKRELGWQPAHPSWRTGFRDALGGRAARPPIAV
jgi:nucleoside-diphosphate-sugar epimerase